MNATSHPQEAAMLKPQQVANIIRLADEGLSLRSITDATGIARQTVRRVIERRRRYRRRKFMLHDPTRGDSPAGELCARTDLTVAKSDGEVTDADAVDELDEHGLYDVKRRVFTRPPERCNSCGAICYMPCLACRLQRRRKRPK
jgi:hypothetical protein